VTSAAQQVLIDLLASGRIEREDGSADQYSLSPQSRSFRAVPSLGDLMVDWQ
jgi:hypothetical protein